MSKETPVPSILYTCGTKEIQDEVEDELANATEPETEEEAQQAIANNTVKEKR